MGIYIHQATNGDPPTPPLKITRPTLRQLRSAAVRQKEIVWFIDWFRSGQDPNLQAGARWIQKLHGPEACCPCDVCDVQARSILACLLWVVGERREVELEWEEDHDDKTHLAEKAETPKGKQTKSEQ